MIEVINLLKKFNNIIAVNNISFFVKRGEIVGFLGPNGAGKTTTMRIIASFLPATNGQVLINNLDVLKETNKIRSLIGYLPEDNPLYPVMKVYEYLVFLAKIRNLGVTTKERLKKVVKSCGLEKVLIQPIGEISKGYRQRVGLAGCLLHDPEILILDEPTNGLDPNQIVEIRSLIKELGKNKTVLLSTHILSEVQATCQKAIIINNGEIVAQGTVNEVMSKAKGKNTFELEIKGGTEKAIKEEILRKIENVIKVVILEKNNLSHRFKIETKRDTDIREAIFKLCVKNKWILLEQTTKLISLEEAFQKLTS